MALVNVRLGPEDTRFAKELREQGIPLSRILREALRAEHARHVGSRARKVKPSAIVEEILRELPAPADAKPRGFSLTDRRAMQEHIAAQLRRARR